MICELKSNTEPFMRGARVLALLLQDGYDWAIEVLAHNTEFSCDSIA